MLMLFAGTAFAQQDITFKDLRDEIHSLKQRVAALELRLAEKEVAALANPKTEPPRPTAIAPQKQNLVGNIKKGSGSFLSGLRNGFTTTSQPAQGLWTQPENWRKIQNGMTPSQVEILLGKASAVKDSIKLRVDKYWLYIGKRPNGQTLQGRVRFFKDKVTSWDHPKF